VSVRVPLQSRRHINIHTHRMAAAITAAAHRCVECDVKLIGVSNAVLPSCIGCTIKERRRTCARPVLTARCRECKTEYRTRNPVKFQLCFACDYTRWDKTLPKCPTCSSTVARNGARCFTCQPLEDDEYWVCRGCERPYHRVGLNRSRLAWCLSCIVQKQGERTVSKRAFLLQADAPKPTPPKVSRLRRRSL
jgi:hypothetical protein